MNHKPIDEYITNTIVFYVNGKKIEDSNVDVGWTLLQYLRTKLGLCGTKLGCGEGGCGACTVMVSKYLRDQKKITHFPVNACLAPICSMHGLAVTTVEGIGSTKTKLHPVQERLAKAHGSQCGFCTPGIVMSMYTLLRNKSKPNMDDLDVAFQGNLCRCTGYRPILEAYKTFTEEWENTRYSNGVAQVNGACTMGDKCCKVNGNNTYEKLFNPNAFTPYHPSQEPIFPPELKTTDKYDKQYVLIRSENITWHRPTTLAELLNLKQLYPHAKIVVGNTEIGVETKFKQMVYPVLIQPSQIPEVTSITETPEGVTIGSAVTLSNIHTFLKQQILKHAENKVRIFVAMLEIMQWFAGEQIRSVGSLGGNVMTGSPISDMIPILMAARASLELQSARNGRRKVLLDEDFFVGYRKTIVKTDEVLISIHIPFTSKFQYFQAYKQARRREDDIAIVNMAVSVVFVTNTNIIGDIKLAFGGMSFKTLSAPTTESKLRGLPWNRNTIELAYTHLLDELPLASNAPGGMVRYRRSLSLSLFFKAFLDISKKLQRFVPIQEFDTREESATDHFGWRAIKSSQFYTVAPDANQVDSLQKPIVHASAIKQATGEAMYCDDIPHQEGELYCAFVLSTKAHANIIEIDPTDALNIDGVHGFVSDNDINNGIKYWGTITYDEKIFNSDKVTSQGQIIGLVVADNQNLAQKAARMVKVKYKELEPVILSIEDAIKHKSFIKSAHLRFERGDVEAVFKKATNVVEGRCRMGGQEHFYLETQACLVIPKREDDEMEIYCSSQNPSEIAKLVCEVLGIAQNKVVVKVKRLGGGFGGKQSQAALLALPMAVAARKYNRPLRCMLDRNEDMLMTGGRHPYMMEYKVAFDDDGKILGCKAKLYNNCGYGSDLSIPVLQKSLTHFDNAYKIPTCLVEGYACKTNLPSNTAFRAFGGPQGMFLAETLIERIANHLQRDENDIRKRNLYKSGDLTHYNQEIVDCTLDKCWRECLKTSQYHRRKSDIQKFNRDNRYKKRGINLIPTKFGIAYEEAFMNQGGALLLVYTDGSVLLSHGGVEMGQGLHTKMIQVASKALGISVDRIHISETATDKVPNTTPTAASSGSDLNGMAVMDACNKIKKRLEPYIKSDPNGSWEDWIKRAYFDRVSLAATGYHKTPDIGYNWDTKQGNVFNYFTFGVACTEVEIDTLTGDHQVLRTDIVMDLGESLNPAIDIGQIEGAFMQGYGLFVLEEMMYSSKGAILTRGPGTYKLPGFSDIPRELNVSLLKGVSNPRAVYSSKGVGEPPLFLGSSVMFAIKDAIKAAREEHGLKGYFRLDPPATVAKIRMLCEDDITSKVSDPKPGNFQPWNIIV